MGNGTIVSKIIHDDDTIRSSSILRKIICEDSEFTILDFIKSVEDWAIVKHIFIYENNQVTFLVEIKKMIMLTNQNTNIERNSKTLFFSEKNKGRGIYYNKNFQTFTPLVIAQTYMGDFPMGKYTMLIFEPKEFFNNINCDTSGQNLISEYIEQYKANVTDSEISNQSDNLENRQEFQIYHMLRNKLHNLTPKQKSKILYAFMKALGKEIKYFGITQSKIYPDFNKENCALSNYTLTNEQFVLYPNPLSCDVH